MNLKKLQEKSLSLPETPGVYLMKNSDGKIIYVGKAKNLKRRVHSYFSAMNKHNAKTRALVEKINDFDFIMVTTELESLLLENTLIKKYRPHYNILLKDDKGYPFIKLSDDEFPTLSLARKRESRGEFFGPFYGSRSAKNIIETANAVFKLPLCKNPSPKEHKKPCLNYSIKRCLAPCAYKISAKDYAVNIDGVREFLKGDIEEVMESMDAKMMDASEKLDFETAALYRDRIRAIKSIIERQKVSSDVRLKGDFVSVVLQNGHYAASVIKVDKGQVVNNDTYTCAETDFDSVEEFAFDYLHAYYGDDISRIPVRVCTDIYLEEKQLLCDYLSDLKKSSVRIVAPQNVTDKQILDMARRNANERIILKDGQTGRFERMFYDLASLMGVSSMKIAEIYDISHLAGSDVVCGMAVCSSKGFVKSRYRKYKISEENCGDDCASLSEALDRRIKRFKDGDEGFTPLPDIIFADGGQAQVNAMTEVVNAHGVDIKVFGLKKDSHHKTKSLVYPDGHEIYLYKHPEVFGVCGQMQEEAHRFAVAYHNTAAKKRTLSSIFLDIEGVGEVKAAALIKHFGSLAAIKKATSAQISEVKGIDPGLALKIRKFIDENLM